MPKKKETETSSVEENNATEMTEELEGVITVDGSEMEDYGVTDERTAKEPHLQEQPVTRRGRQQTARPLPVLTLEVGKDVDTQQDIDNIIWHEIKTSQRKRKPLAGILGQIEHHEDGSVWAIADYKGIRIMIPSDEMMVTLNRPRNESDAAYNQRISMVLNGMVGAEIDFIVRGATAKNKERVAAASRKDAMMNLRQRYYFNLSVNGKPQMHQDRIVEARIIAVGERAIRVEAFGVETTIKNSFLSWSTIPDARDLYFVGDTVLVRVTEVIGNTIDTIRIKADIRSLTEDTTDEKLKALRTQTSCLGIVTDFNKGVYTIGLSNGVRAIADKCADAKNRRPGRGDQVLFVVTKIDLERSVAVGLISRVVKRNL